MTQIAIAQINPVVGDFAGNVKKIIEAFERASSLPQGGARLLLTPELGVCGYPPHDLVERPEMFERNERAVEELLKTTQGSECALAVGHIIKNPAPHGRAAQNVVSILQNGKIVFQQAKTLLPTYDVFDEARYFEPATECKVWDWNGLPVAVAICEDLWADDPTFGRQLYRKAPISSYQEQKAKLVLSLSASPYQKNKRPRRESLHADIARKLNAPLIYVNQVGANDEILFDGGSFAVDSKGDLKLRLKLFDQGFGVVACDLKSGAMTSSPESVNAEMNPPEEIEIVSRGLVLGIKDYFDRTGFERAVIGLSGGIDSAVVATLAVQALGKQNVMGVAMPSQYSSGHSLEDAEILAKNLGIPFEVRPIKFLHSTAQRELSEGRGQLAPLAQENLQSRMRGLFLMTLSNHYRALVLTTGNKSELATGYCTLYGDMCGALAPIADLYKTEVYQIAQVLNQKFGNPIPERSITKAPSAELKPDQKDQDTLPPYEALDALLADYLEKGLAISDLEKAHGKAKGTPGPDWVAKTLKMVELNEFKRRQAAPVLKVSHKAFGIGRRMPVAKRWS